MQAADQYLLQQQQYEAAGGYEDERYYPQRQQQQHHMAAQGRGSSLPGQQEQQPQVVHHGGVGMQQPQQQQRRQMAYRIADPYQPELRAALQQAAASARELSLVAPQALSAAHPSASQPHHQQQLHPLPAAHIPPEVQPLLEHAAYPDQLLDPFAAQQFDTSSYSACAMALPEELMLSAGTLSLPAAEPPPLPDLSEGPDGWDFVAYNYQFMLSVDAALAEDGYSRRFPGEAPPPPIIPIGDRPLGATGQPVVVPLDLTALGSKREREPDQEQVAAAHGGGFHSHSLPAEGRGAAAAASAGDGAYERQKRMRPVHERLGPQGAQHP